MAGWNAFKATGGKSVCFWRKAEKLKRPTGGANRLRRFASPFSETQGFYKLRGSLTFPTTILPYLN